MRSAAAAWPAAISGGPDPEVLMSSGKATSAAEKHLDLPWACP